VKKDELLLVLYLLGTVLLKQMLVIK